MAPTTVKAEYFVNPRTSTVGKRFSKDVKRKLEMKNPLAMPCLYLGTVELIQHADVTARIHLDAMRQEVGPPCGVTLEEEHPDHLGA